MITPLRIELLGGLRALGDDREIVRFKTRKTSSLLGYLAFNLQQTHCRDALIEMFWPQTPRDRGSQSLSQALGSLRRLLEPPGIPPATFVIAMRGYARLNPATVRTDVGEFLELIDSAKSTPDSGQRLSALLRAVELFKGELLPGLYDDWVLVEREWILEHYLWAVRHIVADLEAAASYQDALNYAIRATVAAPDSEEAHYDVIRLYLKLGRPHDAQEQYRRVSRILRRDLGMRPNADLQELIKQIRSQIAIPERRDVTYRISKRAGTIVARGADTGREDGHESVEAPPSRRLPLVLTRFFGREEECARLRQILQPGSQRLVTLSGPGGAGKTRLALEMAHQLAESYANRVYFVPLSDVRDARDLGDSFANALGIPRSPVGDSQDKALRHLGNEPTLVVLDNFEQLADSAATWIWDMLEAAPSLSFVVTSRHRLQLRGETVFPVKPLPVPSRPGGPDRLLEFACVQMFVDRAQSVSPDFQITSRNSAVIAAICQKLEGVPLAIELAAARAHALSPTQMLEQLARRLQFLVSRDKNVELRHQSIRAAICWSYELLPAELAQLYSRLSAFRGLWTPEHAETVTEDPNCFEHLDALVQRSLLVGELQDERMRFRMLEALREHAEEVLPLNEREPLNRRHAEHFLAIAECAQKDMRGPAAQDAHDLLESEHDNLRIAIARHTDNEIGMRLGAALWRFWFVRGYLAEGRRWLEQCLDGNSSSCIARVRTLNGLGVLTYHLGDRLRAEEALHQSLRLALRLGSHADAAEALNNLGVIAGDSGQTEAARDYHTRCLALRKMTDDRWGEAGCLNNLGRVAQSVGEIDTAIDYYRRSRELFEQIGDHPQTAIALNNEGSAAFERHDLHSAYTSYQRSLHLFRETGNRWGEAILLHNLGEVRYRQGETNKARELLEESLSIRGDLGDRAGIMLTLASLGNVSRSEGNAYRAAKLLAASESARRALGIPLNESAQATRERDIQAIRADLSEDDFESAWAAGVSMETDRAVLLAMDREAEAGRLRVSV